MSVPNSHVFPPITVRLSTNPLKDIFWQARDTSSLAMDTRLAPCCGAICPRYNSFSWTLALSEFEISDRRHLFQDTYNERKLNSSGVDQPVTLRETRKRSADDSSGTMRKQGERTVSQSSLMKRSVSDAIENFLKRKIPHHYLVDQDQENILPWS